MEHVRTAVGDLLEVKLATLVVGRAATRGEDDQGSLNSLNRLIRRVRRMRRKSTGYGHGRRWPSSWPSSWTQTTLRISTVVNTTAMHPNNPREYLGIGVRLRYICVRERELSVRGRTMASLETSVQLLSYVVTLAILSSASYTLLPIFILGQHRRL